MTSTAFIEKNTSSPVASHRDGWVSMLLLCLALLLRFGKAIPMQSFDLYGDMVHYNHAAVFLLTRHVYSYWSYGPAAQVTPGYPLFLAFFYWLAGFFNHSHTTQLHFAILGQAFLSALSIYILYRISRFYLSIRMSALAGLLFLTYPPAIWSATLLLTETLYVFSLLLFVWLFLWAVRRRTWGWWFAAGLALGWCTLVRPTLFPLLVAPLLLLFHKTARSTIKQTLIGFILYVCGFLIFLVPWWIRNWVAFHQIILTDKDAGNPLLFGTTPHFATDTTLGVGLSSEQQEALAIERMKALFVHHPGFAIQWYTIDKLGLLFGTPWYIGSSVSGGLLHQLFGIWLNFHLVWVILGLIGLISGIKKPGFWWISLLVLFMIVVQLPFIPINRYVFPIMPFLFLGVGQTLSWLHKKWRLRAHFTKPT